MKKEFDVVKVLDYGEIELIDYMGDDRRIVDAARVSTQKHKIEHNDERDRVLINYLMENRHTSPFEQVETVWRVKLPIFVARQWIRHHTSSVNEVSGRYSILKSEFYVPPDERIKGKGKVNKQGSEGEIDETIKQEWLEDLDYIYKMSDDLYKDANDKGIANELARINLPVATYTEWYFKQNLHNLFHFLKLRMDEHAQWEIRQYANVMADIVKEIFPMAWNAFEEYQLKSLNLSKTEIECLKNIISRTKLLEDDELKLVHKILNKNV